MALKSVIAIDVDDSDFQRFAAKFAEYQDALKSMPGVWQKISQGAGSAASAAGEMGAAVGSAFFALHKISSESDRLTRNTERQARAWEGMARSAQRFTSRVIEATRSLLRWGELTGLVSGILGFGGLFGIERLARNAGTSRREALGLGVTPGEHRAFDVDYSRIVDTGAFLTGVNQALHDVTKRVGLYGAGMTEDELRGKDTAQVGSELLTHLKKIADQTPESTMGNVLEARHLDQFITLQDFQRLKNTPATELEQYRKNFQADTRGLELTREQTKAWQDLQVQLHRAGAEIENAFVRGLVALAPQIERLSGAFAKLVEDVLSSKVLREWVDDLAAGIKWLAEYINRPEFRQSVIDAMKWLGDVGTKVFEFGKSVAEVIGALSGAITAIKGWDLEKTFQQGGVNGPVTDENPKAPGSPAFNQERGKGSWWWSGPDEPSDDVKKEHDDFNAPTMDRLKPYDWHKWLPWNWSSQSGAVQKESYELPRGVRNNNPLNISYVPGQGALGSDSRFGIFDSPESGIAASERQLLLYQDRDRLNTIAQIISKWAPPSENDTASYIAQVSKETGVGPNDRIDLHDRATSMAIVEAMIKRETGRYANPAVVARGVERGLETSTARRLVPNSGKPSSVAININNATGGNAYVSASQLAVG